MSFLLFHEALLLFRQHSREELNDVLQFASKEFSNSVHSFMGEDLHGLRQVMNDIEEKKTYLKQVKRIGTLGVTQLDYDIAVDKGLYYYQGNDFASEIVYSIRRMTEPAKEHAGFGITVSGFQQFYARKQGELVALKKFIYGHFIYLVSIRHRLSCL